MGKKQRKLPPSPCLGKTLNREDWRGRWPGHLAAADRWYRLELTRLGIWPPPPERLIFEPLSNEEQAWE